MSTTNSDIEQHFWRALESQHGIEVAVNDPELYKRRAYKVRRNFEEFQEVSICVCPTDPDKLWLVKKSTGDDHIEGIEGDDQTDG